MEHIYTAIQAASNENAAEFRDAIGAAIATKIQDALELRKIEIASSMFNSQAEEPAEQENISDEDVQTTA
jgi:hypothetical protein